jgi:hypothetical protein
MGGKQRAAERGAGSRAASHWGHPVLGHLLPRH